MPWSVETVGSSAREDHRSKSHQAGAQCSTAHNCTAKLHVALVSTRAEVSQYEQKRVWFLLFLSPLIEGPIYNREWIDQVVRSSLRRTSRLNFRGVSRS